MQGLSINNDICNVYSKKAFTFYVSAFHYVKDFRNHKNLTTTLDNTCPKQYWHLVSGGNSLTFPLVKGRL